MGYLDNNGVSTLWSKIKAKLSTKGNIGNLNGSSNATPSWYAPVSAGSAGQYLVSSGTGAPVWATQSGMSTIMPNGYPNGSVYLTYDSAFDPAEKWGGTWTKRTDTYMFMGITVWKCVVSPSSYIAPLDMYPVGTAFLTYDQSHNPSQEFGGTWTVRDDTYLFMGITIYRRVA